MNQDRTRFGSMAVILGFVGPDLLAAALRHQNAERRRGVEPLPVGELLVRAGALTREQQSIVTRALSRSGTSYAA